MMMPSKRWRSLRAGPRPKTPACFSSHSSPEMDSGRLARRRVSALLGAWAAFAPRSPAGSGRQGTPGCWGSGSGSGDRGKPPLIHVSLLLDLSEPVPLACCFQHHALRRENRSLKKEERQLNTEFSLREILQEIAFG